MKKYKLVTLLLVFSLCLGLAAPVSAGIVDEMEEMGIVGPFKGSKPRAILITREQWQAMRSGSPEQMRFSDLPEGGTDTDDDVPFE